MRALFPVINWYIGHLKLISRKSRSVVLLPFRNLALTCSYFSDNEDFIYEDSITSESTKPVEHTAFFIGPEKFDDFSASRSFIPKTLKKESNRIGGIKKILQNRGWDMGDENGLTIELDEINVIRILNDLFDDSSNAAPAFYFFRWSQNCTKLKHTVASISVMIHLLVSGNMSHRAVDLLLSLVRNNDRTEAWHQSLFDVLEETCRSRKVLLIIYSMLVNTYIKENMTSMALKLVDEMKTLNGFPTIGVCNFLIRKLLESKQMNLACDFLEDMHSRGMVNASIISLFIHQHCVDGSIEDAWCFLRKMRNYGCKPDVVSYTIIIDALCKMGLLEDATYLLFKMIDTGTCPDSVLVTSVIDGFCKARRLAEAKNILKVTGFVPNVFVYNSFISFFCTEGNMIEATKHLDEMLKDSIHPDCCTYTTIIQGYCKDGNLDKALKYLCEMFKRGVSPSIVTYTVILDQYCKVEDLEMAEYLFKMMKRDGVELDVVAYNTLMDGYGRKGQVKKAYELLDMMKLANISPDSLTYNIIIHGLATRGFVNEAREMLEELHRRGFSPVLAYTNIIYGLSKKGNFEEAKHVWSDMPEDGMKHDVVTCSALLHGCCKKRRMEEAKTLFHQMLDAKLHPDLILYNTLINGFSKEGNISEACHLVNMMAKNGIIPNHVTCKALVHAFDKHWVENPAEKAGIKMLQILSEHNIHVHISEFMSMLQQPSY